MLIRNFKPECNDKRSLELASEIILMECFGRVPTPWAAQATAWRNPFDSGGPSNAWA